MTSQTETGAFRNLRPPEAFPNENAVWPGAWDGQSKSGRKFFQPGTLGTDGSFVFATNPTAAELVNAYAMVAGEIAQVAAFSVVQAIYAHNPNSLWLLWRSADPARVDPRMAGLMAFVPLNKEGLAALHSGTFDPGSPSLRHVAPRGDEPAGLYLWAIVAHGLSDLAGKLFGHAIGLDLYESLPMIGTIGTEEGLQALRRSSKTQHEAAALQIGSMFEIKLPAKHIAHQRAMRIWEGRP
jgi:hypothetical protein